VSTPAASTSGEWDRRYSAPEYVYGTAPNQFLASVVHRLPTGRVLSLGEGEGRNAVFLAEQGFAVVGVDRSRVGLAKARRLAAERSVALGAVLADLAGFPIAPHAFDVIVSIFCHLPPRSRAQVHAAVVAGLRPGGVFVLEAYTPRQLAYGTGGPPVPELLVSLSDLETELDGLELAIAREVDRDVVEGRLHHGLGAVVQVLGFKRDLAP
jgi:SAM-dependent methyltransferase